MDNTSYITDIENEYKIIDSHWLRLQFKTAVGLVLFACLAECVLGAVLFGTGTVDMLIRRYLMKYILFPFLLNLFLIGIGFFVMHLKTVSEKAKVYLISVVFAAICFVLYSVHQIFPSLYLIFAIPTLLTVVYSTYVLTIVTSIFSICLKILSDVFVRWDPEVTKLQTHYGIMDFVVSICILCAFSIVCLIVIHFERAKNNAAIIKEIERYHLQIRLRTDDLTGISNKTALREAFQAMEDDDDTSNAYILVMIDLDNFKLLNDTLGHDTGDQVLEAFGRILTECSGDALTFRFGGDEFCILFKNQPMDSVLSTCRLIQERYLAYAETVSKDLPISVSIGVARLAENMTTSELLKNTDDALYQSKLTKNTISIYKTDY